MSIYGKLEIKNMTRKEFDIAINWAAEVGWNPGLNDAECFFAADPNGYFMVFDDGEPVGCASAVAYTQEYGFMGFFIVKPLYRGGRIGLLAGGAALDYLGERVVGIDGVEKKVKNYQHYGFKMMYHNIRYEGVAIIGRNFPKNIKPLSELPFEQVVAYDAIHFSAPRPEFLSLWIKQPESAALAIIKHDRIAGYGVIRACQKGYKIGPLFADDEDLAEELFLGLISEIKPESVYYLDIPEINIEAVELAKRYHMRPVFMTARMYKNGTVSLPMHTIFGVTSFELG